jgi:hypothetical protein
MSPSFECCLAGARSEKERRALVFTLVVDSKAIGIGGGTTTRGRIPLGVKAGGLMPRVGLSFLGGLVVVGLSCNC